MSEFVVLGIGAIYEDIILTVPHFPPEDSKLRATSRKTRLGGNVPNTLGVLSQILVERNSNSDPQLFFMSALGDEQSSRFLISELEKRKIKPYIAHRTDCKSPPTAYILESSAAHTRTIVSHNEVSDQSSIEICENLSLSGLLKEGHEPSFWLHCEGRNCEALFVVFGMIQDPQGEILVSIDFERPGRKGLRELFGYTDVAFVSKSYATFISAQGKTDTGQQVTNADMVGGFLREAGSELKGTTIGYVTVGSEGCYVFVSQGSTHTSAVQSLSSYQESGWVFAHLQASNEVFPELVLETTGAGDTFIAAVIYGLGAMNLNPVQAGRLGNSVAGRKCLQEGYEGVWKEVEFPKKGLLYT